MRVLYWTSTFMPDIGGVAVFSTPLIHGLQKRGVEFLVVASRTQTSMPDETECEGIRVRRYSFHRVLNSHDIRGIASLVREIADLKQSFQPDLIHTNTSHADLFFHQQTYDAWACPVLVTCHDLLVAQERNSLFGRTTQHAAWITAVSQATLDDVRQLMPEITSRSSVILNGLDAPSIQPTPIDWHNPRLLCVGRVSAEKGFDIALRAFAEIHRHVPASRLRLAGDGDARPQLEALAANLGIENVVEFLGWVEPEHIPVLLNQSTLALMPSRSEPFGLIALQTGQMARPIVATAVGGIPEIVVDGETGFLVEPEQPAQLAEKALRLLAHPQRGDAMGKAARQRAALFSMERAVEEYYQLYRKLTS